MARALDGLYLSGNNCLSLSIIIHWLAFFQMISMNTIITTAAAAAAITGEVARAADGATPAKGFCAKSCPHPLHQNRTGGGATESTVVPEARTRSLTARVSNVSGLSLSCPGVCG